jgi:hypothetical protein
LGDLDPPIGQVMGSVGWGDTRNTHLTHLTQSTLTSLYAIHSPLITARTPVTSHRIPRSHHRVSHSISRTVSHSARRAQQPSISHPPRANNMKVPTTVYRTLPRPTAFPKSRTSLLHPHPFPPHPAPPQTLSAAAKSLQRPQCLQ